MVQALPAWRPRLPEHLANSSMPAINARACDAADAGNGGEDLGLAVELRILADTSLDLFVETFDMLFQPTHETVSSPRRRAVVAVLLRFCRAVMSHLAADRALTSSCKASS